MTPTDATARYRYASPAWLQRVCAIVEQQLATAGVDLSGWDYTWGEEFLDVPTLVNPDGNARVGWHATIRNGVVHTLAECPPDDADKVNTVDWQASEALALATFDQIATDPELAKLIAAIVEDGKAHLVIRREQPAALIEALDSHRIHDAVVAITATPT